jgi:hypothetical protein
MVKLPEGVTEVTPGSLKPISQEQQQALNNTVFTQFPQQLQLCQAQSGGKRMDYIVDASGNALKSKDAITMDTVNVTELVEYKYSDDKVWRVSKVGMDSLQNFKRVKYQIWKDQILNEKCEAALKRMIQAGLCDRVFDAEMFPEPEAMKKNYHFNDTKTNKKVDIPHPVAELRIWNATSGKYDAVPPALDNVPQDKAGEWNAIKAELCRLFGDDFVNGAAQGAAGGAARGPCDSCCMM